MKLDTERIQEGKAIVVTLCSANLDAGNVKTFKEEMQPLLKGSEIVLLDMSKLSFVDSSGLGALLSCLRTMNNKSGQLKLFALPKPVQSLFELVRMHRIFSIYNSREEALAAL